MCSLTLALPTVAVRRVGGRKFLLQAFVGPALVLVRSLRVVGRCCPRLAFSLDPSKSLPVLVSQFEVAVCLGAFVPLLLPAATLALW